MSPQEAAEKYAESIKSDKSSVLQVADEFATITRYKKYVTHYLSQMKAEGYEMVKVEGDGPIFTDFTKTGQYVEDGEYVSLEQALEEYNKAIAIGRIQGRREDKWISVEDSLPKKGQLVLGTYIEENMHSDDGWVCAVEYKGRYSNKPKWSNQFLDDTVLVTHWQPLPPPPNC